MRMTVLISLAMILLAGCEQQSAKSSEMGGSAKSADGRTILTTFYPTEYLIGRIAGEGFTVVNPCPPDADPAYWQPDAETLLKYQQADLIVVNGANFEKWVSQATLPKERLVDTTAKLRDPLIELKATVTHQHGSGEHSHTGIDGHTWVDPLTAAEQALAIHAALVKKWPEAKETFDANLAELQADLKALGTRYAELSQSLTDMPLVCNHPAYNYLARRYGWNLETFYFEPEELPGQEELKRLEDYLTRQPAKWMLWESAPTDEVAGVFRERFGLEPVEVSPGESLDAEQREAGEDFLSIMNANVDSLSGVAGEDA
jgi:zinc transport system substrate-binding protein